MRPLLMLGPWEIRCVSGPGFLVYGAVPGMSGEIWTEEEDWTKQNNLLDGPRQFSPKRKGDVLFSHLLEVPVMTPVGRKTFKAEYTCEYF